MAEEFDPDGTIRLPGQAPGAVPAASAGGPWGTGTVPPSPGAVRHRYPLVERDPSLATAIRLLGRSMPYALMRFAVLFVAAIAAILWLCIVLGGAGWLGTHVASVFGWAWFIMGLVATGMGWNLFLRYALHLLECGHVAVLTELITKGTVGNGSEPMFAYGRRIVTERFGQVTLLFGLNAVVRGVLAAFHRTLDFVAELLPIPGLETLSSLLNVLLRAATRYLDKVIFSYSLARGDEAPGRASREGLVYYAQNARPILKTALWVVALDYGLTAVMWVVLMAPAAAVVLLLPESVREVGAVATLLVAALFAGCLRAAVIKPLFLIMMMVRFHSAAEGQAIDEEWDARLVTVSDKFSELGEGLRGWGTRQARG